VGIPLRGLSRYAGKCGETGPAVAAGPLPNVTLQVAGFVDWLLIEHGTPFKSIWCNLSQGWYKERYMDWKELKVTIIWVGDLWRRRESCVKSCGRDAHSIVSNAVDLS